MKTARELIKELKEEIDSLKKQGINEKDIEVAVEKRLQQPYMKATIAAALKDSVVQGILDSDDFATVIEDLKSDNESLREELEARLSEALEDRTLVQETVKDLLDDYTEELEEDLENSLIKTLKENFEEEIDDRLEQELFEVKDDLAEQIREAVEDMAEKISEQRGEFLQDLVLEIKAVKDDCAALDLKTKTSVDGLEVEVEELKTDVNAARKYLDQKIEENKKCIESHTKSLVALWDRTQPNSNAITKLDSYIKSQISDINEKISSTETKAVENLDRHRRSSKTKLAKFAGKVETKFSFLEAEMAAIKDAINKVEPSEGVVNSELERLDDNQKEFAKGLRAINSEINELISDRTHDLEILRANTGTITQISGILVDHRSEIDKNDEGIRKIDREVSQLEDKIDRLKESTKKAFEDIASDFEASTALVGGLIESSTRSKLALQEKMKNLSGEIEERDKKIEALESRIKKNTDLLYLCMKRMEKVLEHFDIVEEGGKKALVCHGVEDIIFKDPKTGVEVSMNDGLGNLLDSVMENKSNIFDLVIDKERHLEFIDSKGRYNKVKISDIDTMTHKTKNKVKRRLPKESKLTLASFASYLVLIVGLISTYLSLFPEKLGVAAVMALVSVSYLIASSNMTFSINKEIVEEEKVYSLKTKDGHKYKWKSTNQ